MTVSNKKQNQTVATQKALAATRMGIGFVFLWAFFDKLFGLGFATSADKSWLNGFSPTTGFLSNVSGPFANIFQSLAGVTIIDWLFMLGLLGVGVALIFGAGVRVAAVAGSALLFFMYLASLPLATNPIIDDHIVYIFALVAIFYSVSNQAWSIGGWWRSFDFVKSRPYLW